MKKFVKSMLPVVACFTLGSQAFSEVTAEKKAPVASSFSGYYSNDVVGPTLKKDDSSYEAYHYLTLKYKVGDTGYGLSAVGRATTTYNTLAGDDKEKTEETGDHYFKVHMPSVFKNDIVTVTPQLRAYLPGESSWKNNQGVTYNPRVYVEGSVGDLNLTYILMPYVYSYKTGQNSEEKAAAKLDGSQRTNFAQGHYFAASYNVNENTSFDLDVYPKWTYKEGTAATYNNLNIIPGVSRKFSNKVSGSIWLDTVAVNNKSEDSSLGASLSVKLF